MADSMRFILQRLVDKAVDLVIGLLFPPWFLLPLILVFGWLGVTTEMVVLLLVAVVIGWVVLIAIGALWFLHTHD
jgi:hypothetical protein